MDFHRFEDLNRGMATPRDVIVPGLPALLLHGDGLNSGAPLHEGMGSGVDSKVHKTEQEKELARQKMFDYIDLKSTGASVRGEECLESTVGRPRRFTESRVVGMSFEKAARGEECNESTVGRSDTRDFSVKIKRGNHTLYTEGYNMQAVEQSVKWGSYEMGDAQHADDCRGGENCGESHGGPYH